MWWIALASALPPDGNPGRIPVGTGAIERMVISRDNEIVAGRDRATGNLFVLQVDSWKAQTAELPCGVTGVAVVPSILGGTSDDAQDLFVSCDDGTVHWWVWSDELLQAVYDTDLEQNVYVGITPNEDPFKGIWWDGDAADPLLYMFEDVGTEGYMHVYSPESGLVNGQVNSYYSNNPATAAGGFQEGVVDNGTLYIAHGSGRTTLLNLSTGNVSYGGLVAANQYTIDDIAAGNGKLWAIDTDRGYLFEYNAVQGSYGIPYTGFVEPRAVVANLATGDEWLMVSGLGIWIYQLQGGLIDITSPTYVNLDAEINIQDAVANSEYTFGGGSGGNIQIITARPWVESSASTSAALVGETFDLTFTIDDPSDWKVTRGGDRTGNGSVITTGTTTTQDATVTVPITVNENWVEGANRIYVVATNSNGLDGHARADVSVDAQPDPPALTDANVSFANQALILTFDGIEDADLAHYSVWISDQPWESGDYATGGPAAPDPGPSTPLVVAAEPGATVTVRLEPLVNGTTYYIGVRATDAGGQESTMSNVVQGVPEEDFTASDLAGEQGGGPCATGPAAGWMAGGLAGLLLLARRRAPGALGAAAVGLALAAPAHAKEDKGDLGPQRGDFELRYGGFLNLADENIKTVYGKGGHNMLQVEFGPQLFRFFEIDIEAGFYQELATTVSASGDSSDVKTMLTWYPLGVSGSFRLQILDEQIVVPHARLGMDFVPWTELTDNASGGKDKVSGSKLGNHYALGASLLLDIFAPARASLLEAQTGINDTYITFEWRRQNIDSRNVPWGKAQVDGFDFSGSMLTVGLKLDY
ncbi:MAG: hypothetical protein H6737_09895 [Alphaproteobacteria bacterium]|nr:hypothetical protein [Alphaproteobacteria bacterium]